MMTMAALGDAVIPVTPWWKPWHTFAQYIDVSITSSIAATFMFSGFGALLQDKLCCAFM